MHPTIFIRLIYAFWLSLIVYLTVAALGVKRDTERHLGQSFVTPYLDYLPSRGEGKIKDKTFWQMV
jgi:hypothetical protein